jgi:hypothetical protein
MGHFLLALTFLLLVVAGDSAACPSVDNVKDACIETTSSSCKASCTTVIKKANSAGEDCVSDLLNQGSKYGFTEEILCYWKAPCGVEEISGMCENIQPPPGSTAMKTTFKIAIKANAEEFFADDALVVQWSKAIADALGHNVKWSQVALFPGHYQVASSTRRLASKFILDVVVYSADAQSQKEIVDDVKLEAFNDNLKTELDASGDYDIETDVDSITQNDNIKYIAEVFEPSADVEALRKYSTSKDQDTWDPWDKEYQEQVGAAWAFNFVCFFIMVVLYWAFLCCHNVKSCCCCCPCINKKSYGGRRYGKLTLCIMYLCVLAGAGSAWYGEQHFQEGVETVTSTITETAKIFDNLKVQNDILIDQSGIMKDVASHSDCTGPHKNDQKQVLDDTASLFEGAADGAGETLGDGGKQWRDIANDLDKNAKLWVTLSVVLINFLFVLVSFMAVIGVCCGSRSLLGVANFTGVLTLIIMAILSASLLMASVFMADFCAINGGPQRNMLVLIEHEINGIEQRELFEYYLTCLGSNPLLDQVRDAADFTDVLAMQTKGLAATCDAAQMQRVYSPVSGVSMESRNALNGITDAASCSIITPLLDTIAQDAVCGSLVSGIFSLWQSQVVTSVFLFFTLIYAAFVREHFESSYCPCLCGGDFDTNYKKRGPRAAYTPSGENVDVQVIQIEFSPRGV